MKNFRFSIFKPIPALILYISYILLLKILKLYIEESLGYAVMIWLGSLFYLYLILYSFRVIFHVSKNKMSTGKAVFNIAVSAMAGVVFFAVNYFFIYQLSNENFIGHIGDNPVDVFISFLYFSFATFATVGYGDISPISSLSKILTILEIIYSFFVIVIAFSSFTQIREYLKDSPKPLFINDKNKKDQG
ncbi:potassium channel family protein [Clostridium cylindrosporum]|uniref:Ion channel n=1 Tax=Clostridium cylindrosporum DSM 605 TaxID=1121307 RepID=A0A0J8DDQ4_CLOCY|nr:potassium channel family protein [Clostridium cylindrosporum]KMT22364.1 Ion channel [Clostridium cylindrosporum DSM 605]